MNPLLHRLGVVRRRFQVVTLLSGVFAALAFVVGATVALGVYDYNFHLPRLLRAAALVGVLVGSGLIVFRYLVYPLAKRSDNLSLALRIEAMHPELNDALASTIQFLDEPESPAMGDKHMRQKAIEKATLQAASFDFHAILDYRFLGLAALALVAALAGATHFLYHEPDLSQTAVLRLGDPFGIHPWTRIDVANPTDRIAVGKPFVLKIGVDGILPRNVKVEVQTKKANGKAFETRPETVVPLKIDAAKRSGMAYVPLDVTRERQIVRYRVLGGDGSYPSRQWQELKVLQPPAFAALDGQASPQVELHFPKYTQLQSPLKLSPGTLPLDMIQGTEVVFHAAADRPLKSAAIELLPGEANPLLRPATLLGLIGDPAYLPQIGPLAFLSTFPWFVPVELDESRTKLSAKFRPWIGGSYVVRLIDEDDLERVYPASLTVSIDPSPMVRLRRPSVSQSYLPTAQVPIQIVADDELAVHSVYVEYRKKNAQGDWLDPESKRVPIYDPAIVAAALRGVVNAPVRFENYLSMRPKRLELSMLWNLKKNRFEAGDIITLQAAADDYCDVFTPRLPGRSQQVELRIVTRDNLDRQLDEGVVEAQRELVALKKIEDEIQNLLNDIPQDKDKIDAKAFDKAVEAEEKLKQVQQRIGERANDGLRDKLEKMQQTMKDNKLPGSEMQDQVKNLAQELDRLAQDDLPKLEQNLSDLRKELGGGKQHDPKQKGPLEKSKDGNKDVQKSIDDLTKSLNRFADLAQLKGQARELKDKQEKLSKETENFKEQLDLAETNTAKRELKKKGSDLAKEQLKLDDETRGLLDSIKKAKKQQDDIGRREDEAAENGDKDAPQRAAEAKDAAKKLRGAEGAANEADLTKNLHGAAEELADQHPNAALDKQKQAAKGLDQIVKKLEGEKDDDIDRLRKKQKDANNAQAGLDKLKKKVNDVQKEQKAGGAEKQDRKQQAEDLRNAAEELREQARRLQRLQEPKAARELQKAAENLEEAAKKLEAGDDADAQQQEMEAQERIQKAQEQLEHLQQELAREQLAQIGDRLKGLKERQDAATERTRELQDKVEKRTNWTGGLLDSLEADRQAQAGLAKESQSLEEKLKGALVFEHIMKKAGKAMEQASESMDERKKAGKDRQTPDQYKAEQADEKKKYDETLRLQKLAGDRLDRLLDALKDPPQQAKKKDDKKQPKKKDPDQKQEDQGGMRPQGDGIPPMAQLRALKAEQVEVFERTKELARENADPMNLDERRLAELRELAEEQGRLRQLFEQMTQRREGDNP